LLQSFVDSEEKIELPRDPKEPAGQVLSDGLKLLWCKEMQICFSAGKVGQDEDTPEGEKADVEAARGVLSSILKRNVWENVVPVLVHLKNLLEEQRSPFLEQLRDCLREILRDFKDDLPAMLSGDPQLAKEIAHDLEEHAPERPAMGTKVADAPAAKVTSRRLSIGTMMRTPMSAPRKLGTDSPCPESAHSASGACIPRSRRLPGSPGTPVQQRSADAKSPISGKRHYSCAPELPVVGVKETLSDAQDAVDTDSASMPRKRVRTNQRGGA